MHAPEIFPGTSKFELPARIRLFSEVENAAIQHCQQLRTEFVNVFGRDPAYNPGIAANKKRDSMYPIEFLGADAVNLGLITVQETMFGSGANKAWFQFFKDGQPYVLPSANGTQRGSLYFVACFSERPPIIVNTAEINQTAHWNKSNSDEVYALSMFTTEDYLEQLRIDGMKPRDLSDAESQVIIDIIQNAPFEPDFNEFIDWQG